MSTVTISITASKSEENDTGQEAGELQAAQDLVQTLRDDGYSVSGSFYGASGSVPLTGTQTASDEPSTPPDTAL